MDVEVWIEINESLEGLQDASECESESFEATDAPCTSVLKGGAVPEVTRVGTCLTTLASRDVCAFK